MKTYIYILISIFLFACDSEDAGDCFQTAGGLVVEEIEVSSFANILVNHDIEVVLKQDNEFRVIVETGKNLLNDVVVEVVENELQLTDNNGCNFVRDYGITKINVYAPDINRIRSSTQYDISSDGILAYSDLTLISENFNSPDSFAVGDFRLQIDNTRLAIISNNISAFYISGAVENLNLRFFAGSSRFEGADLMAQNIEIYHRASNDMIVNPQLSISGEILSTGDVRALNEPPNVDVVELFNGRLIFED